MVQQQLQLVVPLSGQQLQVHLANFQKHQMQGHPPTVPTQPIKDETQTFNVMSWMLKKLF